MTKGRFVSSGFTLIELVIATIIIGVLLAISIPLYLEQAERAMGSKALENLHLIRTAQMLYVIDAETFSNNTALLTSYSPVGPNDADWTYNIVAGQDFFTATATRTSPNASYNNLQISIDQDSIITYPGGGNSYPP